MSITISSIKKTNNKQTKNQEELESTGYLLSDGVKQQILSYDPDACSDLYENPK